MDGCARAHIDHILGLTRKNPRPLLVPVLCMDTSHVSSVGIPQHLFFFFLLLLLLFSTSQPRQASNQIAGIHTCHATCYYLVAWPKEARSCFSWFCSSARRRRRHTYRILEVPLASPVNPSGCSGGSGSLCFPISRQSHAILTHLTHTLSLTHFLRPPHTTQTTVILSFPLRSLAGIRFSSLTLPSPSLFGQPAPEE